jgi:hypothetical protein
MAGSHVRAIADIAKPSQQYRAVLLGCFGEAIRGGQGDNESYCW